MDKIILKDESTFEILEGASLDAISMMVSDMKAIEKVTDSFTKDGNLDAVKFMTDDRLTGEYENLICETFSYKPLDNEASNEGYILIISLRESTLLELRVRALEEGQAVLSDGHASNAEAIETILTDIIPSMDEEVSE